MMSQIKVFTSNARGLGNYAKRRDLFHYYHKNNFHIVFLQETHSHKGIEKIWNTQWGSKIWYSHGTSQARGAAILFAKNLQYEVHNVILDEEGRYVILYCTIFSKKILLSCVYAPNSDNPSFFQKWLTDIKRFSPEFFILGGDFNLVMDLDADKQGGLSVTHTKAREKLLSELEVLEITDIWRQVHPELREFTWRKIRPHPIFERLDFFLISQAMSQLVLKVDIKPGLQTDHSAVLLELDLTLVLRGPSYWKLNTSLLRDADYLEKLK